MLESSVLLLDSGPDAARSIAGELTILVLTLIVMGLLLVVGLMAGVLSRWRKRQKPAPPRVMPSGKGPDPWSEAGRRATAPSAAQLADAGPENQPGPIAGPIVSGERPVAVVTGGARRVGRAIAERLAQSGCDVIITYNSSSEEAAEFVAGLSRWHVQGSAHRLDFLDVNAIELFAAFLVESLPRLDILVHNASVYTPSPLFDLSAEEVAQQYRVNALAPLMLTTRLAGMLRDSKFEGGGSVVAMLDIHALGRPRRDFAAYAMSKAALAEMVRSLSRDLAPHVRVNGVAPGVVAWPEAGYESGQTDQEKYLRRVPLGRPGTPEEAAEAVRWLAMDARYVTGEIIRVDGGRWLT